MKTKLAKLIGGVLLSLSLAVGMLGTAFAADVVPTFVKTDPVKLTIKPGEQKCPAGVEFKLYRVATMDYVNGQFVFELTDGFEKYANDFDIYDMSNWDDMAEVINGIADGDNAIKPFDTAKTNDQGIARFPNNPKEAMLPAVYLVVGGPIKVGNTTKLQKPYLRALPEMKREGRKLVGWIYDCEAIIKPGATFTDKVDREVLKIWDDEGVSDKRPSSITVRLFCDGKELTDRKVTLSASNNWRHVWKDLEAGHNYTIKEEGADGYTKSITLQGATFTLKNTKRPPKTPPKNPPKNPNPPTPETPRVLGAVRPMEGLVPRVLGADRLPQTGLLWWPAPIMAALGMLLFLYGYSVDRRDKAIEEATKK